MVLLALLVDQNSTPAQKLQPSQPSRSQPASSSSCAAIKGSKKFTEHPLECPPSPRRIHIHLCLLHLPTPLPPPDITLCSQLTEKSAATTSWLGTKVAVETFRSSHPEGDWLGVSWEEDTVLQVSIEEALPANLPPCSYLLGPARSSALSASRSAMVSLA